MATPLRARHELDVAGLERLVEHIVGAGVAGLFILGTTGEAAGISPALRRDLVSRVCRQVARRVPVLVGITDTVFTESVALARHAAREGADAVVLAPPYFLPPGPPELREYLDDLLPELPLPVLLYSLPAFVRAAYDYDTIRYVMDRPAVIGLKDSSGGVEMFRRLRSSMPLRPDWSLLVGPEELICDAVAVGAHGGVAGGANLFPHLYQALCAAALAGDAARARLLQDQVCRVGRLLYRVGGYDSGVIKGIKCGLSCLGICDDLPAGPLRRFGDAERERVRGQIAVLQQEIAAVMGAGTPS